MLYHSLIETHLTYANPIWGPMSRTSAMYKKLCKKIMRLQETLKISTKVLGCNEIITLNLGKLAHRYIHDGLPIRVYNLFENPRNNTTHNTRNSAVPLPKTHKNKKYNESFLNKTSASWLPLKDNLRKKKSLKSFSKGLKNHLLTV